MSIKRNISEIKYKDNDTIIMLHNCKTFGIQDLYPVYNKKELFPTKIPHYIIETMDKKINFIEVKKVIEIKFEEMVT